MSIDKTACLGYFEWSAAVFIMISSAVTAAFKRSFSPNHGGVFMRTMIVCLLFLWGCGFSGSAVFEPDAASDNQATDAVLDGGVLPDASPDAPTPLCPNGQVRTPDGCRDRPHVQCSLVTDEVGVRWRVLEFTGWVTYGLLDSAPLNETPLYIAYGSDFDASFITATCSGGDRWRVPYPSGCRGKPQSPWMGEPEAANVLKFSENVENFNIAIVYTGGSVRWADLKIDDGDPDGFTVGGSGNGYHCHVVHPDGIGGIIRVAP